MPTSLRSLKPVIHDRLRSLLDTWFPRVVDKDHGGFSCDFDYRWRQRGPNNKMLEYQARTLRFVARAARLYPDLLPCAKHGFEFLCERMWDSEYGGWYRMVDKQGKPLQDGVKHGHGTAYAISACIWYYRLTQEQRALDLAWEAFCWLEDHAHDEEFGGYFSFYQRNGQKILDPSLSPGRNRILDPLNNPIGFKESNTTVDLTEALGQLYETRPEPLGKARLGEMLDIIMRHIIVAPGGQHLAFARDWKPIPHVTIYAMCLQTASIIVAASRALEKQCAAPDVMKTAKMLVDHMLRIAWDESRGGFFQAGWVFGRTVVEGCELFVADKTWWCQAEGLRALFMLAENYPEAEYGNQAIALWQYIDRFVIDHKYGGWREKGCDSERFSRRAAKASDWKDPCHEGFALISAIETFNRMESKQAGHVSAGRPEDQKSFRTDQGNP